MRVLSDIADGSVNWCNFQMLLIKVWSWYEFSGRQLAFTKLIY